MHCPVLQPRAGTVTWYHRHRTFADLEAAVERLAPVWGELEFAPYPQMVLGMPLHRLPLEVACTVRAHGVARAVLLGEPFGAVLRALPVLRKGVGGDCLWAPDPTPLAHYQSRKRLWVACDDLRAEALAEVELVLAALAGAGWDLQFPGAALAPPGDCQCCAGAARPRVRLACGHQGHWTCLQGQGGFSCQLCTRSARV